MIGEGVRRPSSATAGGPSASGLRRIRLGGRSIAVVLPRRDDVRLRLSAVIITLQVLGQTVLGFKVSIAQIVVTIGVCALIDTTVTLRRRGILMWPASAILTGNGIAFILRASGTRHGDWWSLNGIQWFVAAAVVAMLSKLVVRPQGRHLYNPSNLGLVAVLLVGGVQAVFPQYLWWGAIGFPVGVALAVIALGAVTVVRPVGMWPMAVAFLVPFTALVAGLAAGGAAFSAVWHSGPVAGAEYWADICLSPELLIFVLFMMSDPRTAPATRWGRVIYGAATAVVAAGLLAVQETEFGVKVSILAALTLVCTAVPVIDRLGARLERRPAAPPGPARLPALVAAGLIATLVPVATLTLSRDQRVVDIERTPPPPGSPGAQ